MVRKSKLLGMFIGSLLIGYSSVSFAYNLDPYGGHLFLASKKCSKWQLKMHHLPTPKLFAV